MTTNIQDFSSREALLSANSVLIGQLQARLKAKRFRPQEGDSVKIGYIRALRACLKIKLNPTIGIGLIHLNRKTLALNR